MPSSDSTQLDSVQPCGIIAAETLNLPRPNPARKTECLALGRSRGLRGFAFVLVLLGACVFGWGLHYKLSLYGPPHSLYHRVPQAKLFPGRESGDSSAVHVRPLSRTEVPPGFSLLLLTFVLLTGSKLFPDWRALALAPPASAGMPPGLPRLSSFIRPPPRIH